MSVSVCAFCITDLDIILSAKLIRYCRKKQTGVERGEGGEVVRTYSFETRLEFFGFFTASLEIAYKAKLRPLKLCNFL